MYHFYQGFFVNVLQALLIFIACRIVVHIYAKRKIHHVPGVWDLKSLINSASTVSMSRDGQTYVPCRPQIAIGGLFHRLRCAWLAFTGQCDLVRWPGDQ